MIRTKITGPSVFLLGYTVTDFKGMADFVEDLTYSEETSTAYVGKYTDTTPCMLAGQLCYMSFGEKRTKDHKKYIEKILAQGHGSVLEHATVTLGFTGIDRAVTHELIRHRAGFGYSQVSQRYVDTPNFVYPYEDFEHLVEWGNYIDSCVDEYSRRLGDDTKLTTKEKKVNRELARRCLPNETEAPIVVTGNIRAWRHFLEMRGSIHADVAIRKLAIAVYERLVEIPGYDVFFQDFINSDGILTSLYSKV